MLSTQLSRTRFQDEDETRWGNRDVEITGVRMFAADGDERWVYRSDEATTVEISYAIKKPVTDLVFGVGHLTGGWTCNSWNEYRYENRIVPVPDYSTLTSTPELQRIQRRAFAGLKLVGSV